MKMSARVSNDKYKQEILMLDCPCGHSTRSKARRAASKARELLSANESSSPTAADGNGGAERKTNMSESKTIEREKRGGSSGAARSSGTPDELEQACLTLCVGDFWCDANQHVRRIYNILVERKLMTCNRHGQMVEVSPNGESSESARK